MEAKNYEESLNKFFRRDSHTTKIGPKDQYRVDTYAEYCYVRIFKCVPKMYSVPHGNPVKFREEEREDLKYDRNYTIIPEKINKPTTEWITETIDTLYPHHSDYSGDYQDYTEQILIGKKIHNVLVVGDDDFYDRDDNFYQFGIDIDTGAIFRLFYDIDGVDDLTDIDYSKPYRIEEIRHEELDSYGVYFDD